MGEYWDQLISAQSGAEIIFGEVIKLAPIFILLGIVVLMQMSIRRSRNGDSRNRRQRITIHNEIVSCRIKLKALENIQSATEGSLKSLTQYLTENFKAPYAIALINRCVDASRTIDLSSYRLYEKGKIENDLMEILQSADISKENAPKTRDDIIALQNRLKDRIAKLEQEKNRLNNTIKELEVREVMLQ